MLTAVGSTNPVKLSAIKAGLTQAWPGADTLPVKDAESGVRAMPLSLAEIITGARNRAAAALKAEPHAQMGAGPEGGVFTDDFGMFLVGAVVVMDRRGRIGTGLSGGVQLPDAIRRRIEAGEELGPIMDGLMSSKENEIRRSVGANGVLTFGLYGRYDEFLHATVCALAPWRNDLYKR